MNETKERELMIFQVGDHVRLPANDRCSEEYGEVVEVTEGKITCVCVDEVYRDDSGDDGLRDVMLDDAIRVCSNCGSEIPSIFYLCDQLDGKFCYDCHIELCFDEHGIGCFTQVVEGEDK